MFRVTGEAVLVTAMLIVPVEELEELLELEEEDELELDELLLEEKLDEGTKLAISILKGLLSFASSALSSPGAGVVVVTPFILHSSSALSGAQLSRTSSLSTHTIRL